MKRSLFVVALGGNALSPPHGLLGMDAERVAIERSADELAALDAAGHRLLVVHGNGPQVGRLLSTPGVGDLACLDVHVAQTQGEIGYLVAEALDRRLGRTESVAVVTRVLVDPNDSAFARPTKPVGRVLDEPPADVPSVRTPDGAGWRRVVGSPRPVGVIEQDAIRTLLGRHHVIAGGGGGVPLAVLAGHRRARPAVVDKDWVAAMLAIAFRAECLVFVTDVANAFDNFGDRDQNAIGSMTPGEARRRLATGTFAPGSMEPKVHSAVEFVETTGHPAVITTLGSVASALRGTAGTTIRAQAEPAR